MPTTADVKGVVNNVYVCHSCNRREHVISMSCRSCIHSIHVPPRAAAVHAGWRLCHQRSRSGACHSVVALMRENEIQTTSTRSSLRAMTSTPPMQTLHMDTVRTYHCLKCSTFCAVGRSWALLLSCDTHCRFVCLLQLCLQLKAYRATCRRFRLISQTFFSTVTSKMSVLESASHMVY